MLIYLYILCILPIFVLIAVWHEREERNEGRRCPPDAGGLCRRQGAGRLVEERLDGRRQTTEGPVGLS